MSADPIDISSILTDQGAILEPQTLAAMLLWSAQTSFARETGNKDQIAFVDLAMRLYAGALHKIDQGAAGGYLRALYESFNPYIADEEKQQVEHRRNSNLDKLREKLALAAMPAGGSA